MGKLFVGAQRPEFVAEDRIVVSLHAAIAELVNRYGYAVLVSPVLSEDVVWTLPAMVDPTSERHNMCLVVPSRQDTAVDPVYLQCALDQAEALQGWIVLDAHDDVVTDLARALQIKRRVPAEARNVADDDHRT